MKFTTGAVFGSRYTLGERIAVGGMGEVWQATDQVLGRVVAIKLLSPALAAQPGFAQRFREEARNTAALTHPNIAAVYDYGEDDGAHWLVMELVDGQPLSTIISEQGPLSAERTSAIAAQAALALQAAHDKGVIHRDVKPANILVRLDGTVKLTDFGIARAADAAPITRTGEVMGTAQYISPEQATGATLTPACDLYSLGVVAHEMLTGRRPFDEGSPVATAMAHVSTPPPPLPETVPPHLAGIVMACLAKEPSERPASAGHVATALRSAPTGGFLATEAIPAQTATQRLSAPTAVAPSARPAPAARPPAEDPEEKKGLNPLFWILPLLLVLALGGWWIATQLSGEDTPAPAVTTPVETVTQTPTQTPTPEGVTVTASDYVGMTYDQAAAALGGLGLQVQRQDVDSDQNAGQVVRVSPSGRVDLGSTIVLEVSRGPAEVTTPPQETTPQTPAAPETPATVDETPAEEDSPPPEDSPVTGAAGTIGPAGTGVGAPVAPRATPTDASTADTTGRDD